MDRPEWSRMVQAVINGPEWSRMVQAVINGPERSGISDTSNTSNTPDSSDAIKTSASVIRLSSYF